MNTKIKIGELELKNPVLTASGTFGYAKEFMDFVALEKLGGIITKTITLKPRLGNPPPRVIETPSGMLNAIGLQNEGIDNFLKEKVPFFTKLKTPLIVSIGGESREEYQQLARILDKVEEVKAIELNISCPNVRVNSGECIVYSKRKKNNRLSPIHYPLSTSLIAQSPDATYDVVKAVRKSTKKTLITKLSPNVTDITAIAQAAEKAGADAVSLVNTFLGMSVDIKRRAPVLGNVTGGLSGPAIKPIALRMAWQVAKAVKIPVIGMGGIMNIQDALEFIIAGASAICVGTANFVDPGVSVEIVQGLKNYMIENKIKNLKEIIGSLKT